MVKPIESATNWLCDLGQITFWCLSFLICQVGVIILARHKVDAQLHRWELPGKSCTPDGAPPWLVYFPTVPLGPSAPSRQAPCSGLRRLMGAKVSWGPCVGRTGWTVSRLPEEAPWGDAAVGRGLRSTGESQGSAGPEHALAGAPALSPAPHCSFRVARWASGCPLAPSLPSPTVHRWGH